MTKRNYGVDALRIVAMFFVCMVHVFGQGGLLHACDPASPHYKIFWLMEIVSYCAVDCFMLISGYTASPDKPRNYVKLAEMWFQAFFYSFVVTVALNLLGYGDGLNFRNLIRYALPVTLETFWYFTAYFLLSLASPILNKALFALSPEMCRRVLVGLLVMFSLFSTTTDPFKLLEGYSTMWILVLYCLGVLMQRVQLFRRWKSWHLLILLAACVAATWVVKVVFGRGTLFNYVSPTIVVQAMVLVVLFSRMRLKGTVLRQLTPVTFGIYLFQLSPVIWEVFIRNSTLFIADLPILQAILWALAAGCIIFFSGLLVETLRYYGAKLLHIPQLCRKLVDIIDRVCTKIDGLIA